MTLLNGKLGYRNSNLNQQDQLAVSCYLWVGTAHRNEPPLFIAGKVGKSETNLPFNIIDGEKVTK